jgi:hypothetical protein
MIIAGANELVVMLVCCLDVDVPNEPRQKTKIKKMRAIIFNLLSHADAK